MITNKDIFKMRKALETIRDSFWTDGETDKEKVDDLKAIAFNVIDDIDNNIEAEQHCC